LRIKAAIWLNEQDSNGQLKHLGTTVYGVDVEWEAPTANQQIADYINNTILPSLTPVYGSDGTTIVEWVSPDAGAGGQCKTWVQQNLIPSIFGENVIIPRTNGDDLSKWTLQNNDLIEVNHISGFTSETALETIKTHFSSAVKGDLVQMYMRYVNGDEGPHTMVVLDITTSGLLVIDSNYRFDGTIRIHTISFDSMANSLIASTIYRATPNSL
jgi:hypothetical protein